MARRRPPDSVKSVALRPADPFELIRWLARSQSDPRKATAELVQNSLDAGARRIEVERVRVRGHVALVVRDDGEGVLPELGRNEALEYLATHIGHSRKLGLSTAERAQRVVAGKYGVGLLGFWAIGHVLELRTRVGGSVLVALRLVEDSPKAQIIELPVPIGAPATFTEAAVLEVHEQAQKVLAGRRLSEYLGAELRGQLLQRDVQLLVHDRVARGLAQKRFEVVPLRFVGEPLSLPAALDVPGFDPVRVELYLARGAQRPAISVACMGSVVADDVTELGALGLGADPWLGRELTGLLDFPSFTVPPGTRRGVQPDWAAAAFVDALARLAPLVQAELRRLDAERRAAQDRDVHLQLRRALRGLRRRLPQYDLPEIAGGGEPTRPGDGGPERGSALDEDGAEPSDEQGGAVLELFPPGPLAEVRLAPSPIPVAPGHERRARATPRDADGRVVPGATLAWRLADPRGLGLELRGEGKLRAVFAPPDAPLGAAGELVVEARADGTSVVARAPIEIVEPAEEPLGAGIPEPHLVSDPDNAWRSRTRGERWEVNESHEDYRALRGDARARLRYLLALLAREIVLRTTGRPETAEDLDALVAILAHAERNLRGS